MAKVSRSSEHKHTWNHCSYCNNVEFKAQQDFTRHLRERHCTREGGSFVCRYGYNGVCSSLPVEGVNDEDYEEHVYKHHVAVDSSTRRGHLRQFMATHHSSETPSIVADGQQWTLYCASQNLPAVLNDPNRGKQRDFFTKLWGDGFVDKVDVSPSPHLPEITLQHFDSYIKKIARRYRKHVRMNTNSAKPSSHNELLQHFPNLRAVRHIGRPHFDISGIPKIFLQPSLELSNPETFNAVFPFSTKEPLSPGINKDGSCSSHQSGKLLQEKLSHYLDEVEVQIAQQVAHKSDAFFHAMTSHDALSEQLMQTVGVVRALREKIRHIDKTLVEDSLNILKLERLRANHTFVTYKLKLMATVHQTQPTIQLLLSTPDYVAALELIATTQEILLQELAGIHSFRHLSSQLLEMERLIDKMLTSEFERYATADLNRPLTEVQQVLAADKLISIIFGMLRQKHLHFIDTYKDEAFTAIKTVVKQMVIEVLAASDTGDSELGVTGHGDTMQHGMALPDWLNVLQNTTHTLMKLIKRVKAVHDVMRQAADVSAGKMPSGSSSIGGDDAPTEIHVTVGSDPSDSFLSEEEHQKVCAKLQELLTSVCDFAHERVAQLVSAQDRNQVSQSQPPLLMEKATASEVCELSKVIDAFTEQCERVCGRTSTALKSAFKVQASRFVQRFHQDRKNKLNLILDSERWKQAEVPAEFQDLVNHITETGNFSLEKRDAEGDSGSRRPASFLFVGEEKYAVVGTVLLMLKMVAEYCACAEDLSLMAHNLCRHLAELLQLFNSKCCQLVLGAGALQVAGLKTITSTNLALSSRALQLLLWLLPYVRTHFQGLIENQNQSYRSAGGVNALDAVKKNVQSHVKEVDEKVLSIISILVIGQLAQWEARPPVPSQPFRNISRHLTKLHEAIANILPPDQVSNVYMLVHRGFKEKLREQLAKMGIVNNGGPQHGIVTSELTFYLEALKSLKVLPPEELEDETMKDIWDTR
ncbi:vacuolar protein sorting-associated protein 54 [Anabrus simplex]|uniref:vacuolar protein sorting-associated protein 54 n=1 Tax=Anabrus simplex TaxID=316456 RepID=UPI0035A31874